MVIMLPTTMPATPRWPLYRLQPLPPLNSIKFKRNSYSTACTMEACSMAHQAHKITSIRRNPPYPRNAPDQEKTVWRARPGHFLALFLARDLRPRMAPTPDIQALSTELLSRTTTHTRICNRAQHRQANLPTCPPNHLIFKTRRSESRQCHLLLSPLRHRASATIRHLRIPRMEVESTRHKTMALNMCPMLPTVLVLVNRTCLKLALQ